MLRSATIMAFFSRRVPLSPPEALPPPEPAPPPEPPPARRFTDTLPDQLTTLGPSLVVTGEIESEDAVVVAGKFDGRITTTALFQVAESGEISGSVRAGNAAVGGELSGTLEVTGKIELRSTSHVCATLRASGVAMAEGSFFDGDVHMTEGGSPRAFQERRKSS